MADISCWVPSDRPGPVNPGTAATCQKGGEGGREGGRGGGKGGHVCYIDNVCFVGLFSDEKAPPNHLPADWLATIASLFSPFSMASSV